MSPGENPFKTNATIRDVARLAGVSVATVSRVLNDPAVVTFETKERVLAAISRLGYSPNPAAASLRRSSRNLESTFRPESAVEPTGDGAKVNRRPAKTRQLRILKKQNSELKRIIRELGNKLRNLKRLRT